MLTTQERIIYTEKQKFNQWWMYAILLLTCFGTIGLGLYECWRRGTIEWVLFVVPVLTLIAMAGMTLKTTITDREIRVGFWFWTRTFYLRNLREAYVRTYEPIGEYGGWGIRTGANGKAFNASGNQGLQLIFKDGGRLLIGTQQPGVIATAIEEALAPYTEEQTPSEQAEQLELRELRRERRRAEE